MAKLLKRRRKVDSVIARSWEGGGKKIGVEGVLVMDQEWRKFNMCMKLLDCRKFATQLCVHVKGISWRDTESIIEEWSCCMLI